MDWDLHELNKKIILGNLSSIHRTTTIVFNQKLSHAERMWQSVDYKFFIATQRQARGFDNIIIHTGQEQLGITDRRRYHVKLAGEGKR